MTLQDTPSGSMTNPIPNNTEDTNSIKSESDSNMSDDCAAIQIFTTIETFQESGKLIKNPLLNHNRSDKFGFGLIYINNFHLNSNLE